MLDINQFDVLVLPGSHNSGPEHWQTHWEAAFPNMCRVEQDNWDEPVYSEWSHRLSEAVGASKRPILMVAHSLGTALAVRWSQESAALTNAVAGAFLVAPSDIDRLTKVLRYPALGFDPVIMERLPFPSVVLASRDDDRVTFERAEAFASAWGASFIDVGMQGHIGSAAKLGLWPQGLVWLGQFIASISNEAHT
ncbi:serine hydrolase family protein [Cupriavidus necator]|uniref:Serine hydrolase family protein n=1 Tax=Cupriavidus necator TaxID=106590 RepID=A0A1U9UK44_CUPNE|nr:alpha/beta hydrolase [Cupriavidus necator]AQV92545.1 serine hydrolase family protein [Cupriavidus necator]